MRHLRDPITGLCTVCGKSGLHDHSGVSSNYHDDYDDGDDKWRSRPSSARRSTRKVIYVNSSPTMTEHIDRPGSATSITSSRSTHVNTTYSRSPSPTTSERSYRIQRSSSPAQSTRSSRRTTVYRYGKRRRNVEDSGCCGDNDNSCGDNRCCDNRCCRRTCFRGRSRRVVRRNRKTYDMEYGDDYYEDRCCGYRDFETASYGAGTWGSRHCCAVAIGLGVLAGLAGLAVALYFGITAGLAEAKRKKAVASFIQSNKVNYIVYGVDQLCNSYNNGTKTSVIPNCAATTTRIVIAPNFAAPTDPSWAIASSATSTFLRAIAVGGSGGALKMLARAMMQTQFLMTVLELVVFYMCCSMSTLGGDYFLL